MQTVTLMILRINLIKSKLRLVRYGILARNAYREYKNAHAYSFDSAYHRGRFDAYRLACKLTASDMRRAKAEIKEVI